MAEVVEIPDDSDEEEPEIVSVRRPPIDLTNVHTLSEVTLGVDHFSYRLPENLPGVIIVNKLAFQTDESGPTREADLSLDTVLTVFQNCVVFDLFKTLIQPESLSSRSALRLAKHRGEYQTVEREIIYFLFKLQEEQIPYCACTYIGRKSSEACIAALKESRICSLVPVIFVVFNRHQKPEVARKLQAIAAVDDQFEVVRGYRRAGVFAIQVIQFGLRNSYEEILNLIRRSASEKGVGCRVLR